MQLITPDQEILKLDYFTRLDKWEDKVAEYADEIFTRMDNVRDARRWLSHSQPHLRGLAHLPSPSIPSMEWTRMRARMDSRGQGS